MDLETYIKKLANSRKRILLVNDILQNVQVYYIYKCRVVHVYCYFEIRMILTFDRSEFELKINFIVVTIQGRRKGFTTGEALAM